MYVLGPGSKSFLRNAIALYQALLSFQSLSGDTCMVKMNPSSSRSLCGSISTKRGTTGAHHRNLLITRPFRPVPLSPSISSLYLCFLTAPSLSPLLSVSPPLSLPLPLCFLTAPSLSLPLSVSLTHSISLPLPLELLSFTDTSYTVNEGAGYARIGVQLQVNPLTDIFIFNLVVENTNPPSALGKVSWK